MKIFSFENGGDYSISSFVCEKITFVFRKVFFFFFHSHRKALQVSNNGIISQLIITNNNIVPFDLRSIH